MAPQHRIWLLAGAGWTFGLASFMAAIFMWLGQWRRAAYCAAIAAGAVGLGALVR